MQSDANPYHPPQSNVELPSAQSPSLEASKGRRFGTFVVDYVCFLACCFAIGIVLSLVLGEQAIEVIQGMPDVVLGLLILFVYYAVCEGLWARTPGKFVFGTRVVTLAGGKPPLGQIVQRTLCRFIPFEPLSFLGKRGWHDSISKTRVVRIAA
jgi:uncharacterized RDD family membrane protein YckC